MEIVCRRRVTRLYVISSSSKAKMRQESGTGCANVERSQRVWVHMLVALLAREIRWRHHDILGALLGVVALTDTPSSRIAPRDRVVSVSEVCPL